MVSVCVLPAEAPAPSSSSPPPFFCLLFFLASVRPTRPYNTMLIARLFGSPFCLALSLAAASLSAAEPANQLTTKQKAAGWKLLFDGTTTDGWHSFKKQTFPSQGWVVADGWLHCLGQKGGDILSDGEYDQFDLQWDWKLAPSGNSGLKYFVLEPRKDALGHEYQMIDDVREADAVHGEGKRLTASFYDVLKPSIKPPVDPPSELNHSRVSRPGQSCRALAQRGKSARIRARQP